MTENTLRTSARWGAGAIVLAVNALLYLIAEAVAAAAWNAPAYSYAYNYISDLGVPEVAEFQGRPIDSPLHLVMNTAFVAHGVLFLIGTILLYRVIIGTAARRTLLVLATLHAVGISMVGLFHGSQAAIEDGTAALHGGGALLAIVAGNAAVFLVGIALIRGRLSEQLSRVAMRWVGTILVALGALGIASFGYLLATAGSATDGIPERIAVYTIMAAELVTAATLLASWRPRAATHPELAPQR